MKISLYSSKTINMVHRAKAINTDSKHSSETPFWKTELLQNLNTALVN